MRFTVHASGKTSYQILKGKPYTGEVASFSESVWLRDVDPQSKLDPRWYKGIWLGKAEGSDEHIVATREKVWRTRAIRRRPDSERFPVEEILNFCRCALGPSSEIGSGSGRTRARRSS